jgi:hypothetical protein
MSNTIIQIRRSNANTIPLSLEEGELAYSYLSNTLFIGNSTNGVINIGGNYYTADLDRANASNSISTLVRRFANGASEFHQLNISAVPTVNTHVATKFYVDNAIVNDISLETLTDVIIVGAIPSDQNNKILIGSANGNYISRDVSGNVRVSNTGVFTIGTGQVIGPMLANILVGDKTFSNNISINENLTVSGNLTVLGNTTSINVETLTVEDSLIRLASNNLTDSIDIGFYGVFNGNTKAGLYRDYLDGTFKLFTDYTGDLSSNVVSGLINLATIQANVIAPLANISTANVSSLYVDSSNFGEINVSGNVQISQDLKVNGNIAFINATNVVVAYTYYNDATDSIDTIFV